MVQWSLCTGFVTDDRLITYNPSERINFYYGLDCMLYDYYQNCTGATGTKHIAKYLALCALLIPQTELKQLLQPDFMAILWYAINYFILIHINYYS